jgi:indole-3-glycerol phosphate synthase
MRPGGATCLSVLTDTPVLSGRAGLPDPAARAPTALPCLRKDFMYDPYQVAEARAWGAMHPDHHGQRSRTGRPPSWKMPRFWGMDALIEVHDAAELDRALKLKSR